MFWSVSERVFIAPKLGERWNPTAAPVVKKLEPASDLLIGKSISIGSMYGIFTYIWWILW